MKDELGREIMKEFVGLREKQHSYLKDQNDKGKSAIGTEKCVIKRKVRFQDSENCVEAAQIKNGTDHLGKNKNHVASLKEDFIKRIFQKKS